MICACCLQPILHCACCTEMHFALVAGDCICSSTTTERVWVEVGRDTVLSYAHWLRAPTKSQTAVDQTSKKQVKQGEASSSSGLKKKKLNVPAVQKPHAVSYSKGTPLFFVGLNGTSSHRC